MKHELVLSAAAAVMLAVTGNTLAQGYWHHAATLGMRRFVVVEPGVQDKRGTLERAARDVCAPGQPCGVVFMREAAAVPKKLPLTRAQQESVIAQFFRNPVDGSEELLLKCEAHEPIDHKCLR